MTNPAAEGGTVREMDIYNYPTFPSADDPNLFATFFEHLKPGERAPDPELFDLASGDKLRLSEMTRHGLTIIELGSLT